VTSPVVPAVDAYVKICFHSTPHSSSSFGSQPFWIASHATMNWSLSRKPSIPNTIMTAKEYSSSEHSGQLYP
jgi:hypothetical protein